MRTAGWVAVALAGVTGIVVLLTTYAVAWTNTGVVDGLTTLLPVPVAFACGLGVRRSVGLVACLWLAVTNELSSGYVNPFVLVMTLGPWLAGVLVRERQQVSRRLQEVGHEIESESQRLAHEAVRLERARIARELHDIVAHCVSVMVVQAYAGERLAAARQDPAAEEVFDHIAVAAGQARREIGNLVDLLGGAALAVPEQDLGPALRALVAGAAATGLDVSLSLSGRPDEVPAPAAAVVYRVVQESLTNALKHSPGAPVGISVECGWEIVVDVVNGAGSAPGARLGSTGAGHGLSGIRDRINGLDGTFQAGPEPAGSWRVSVRFCADTKHPAG